MNQLAKILLLCFITLNLKGQDKPNVLFIAIDDLNDYVNCMNGAIKAKTPNIDRLAQQGVLFTNAHCQAPICGPSRASIMTGLYPVTSGNYLQVEDKDIKKGSKRVAQSIFMPDYFESFDYKTFAVGKIYHNGDKAESFDEYGGGFDWFGPFPAKRIHYDPAKRPNKVGKTATDWGVFPEHDHLMTDYKVADYAVHKLQQDMSDPFFLAVGFLSTHVPWYAPQKWFDMFPLDSIQLPPFKLDDFDDIPVMGQRVSEAPMMPTTEELIKTDEWKSVLQAYLACISFVDDQVGKVLDALENSKYANNTIVVLWSDHGYHLGEKNRFAKQALWERDTRTVLIFKSPKGRGGIQINVPVQLIDIYPTLLELCHLPANKQNEGHSLESLINNTNKKWPHAALSFYGVGNVSVRDGRYRLIQYEDGSQELYDLAEDKNEWVNLVGKDGCRDIIRNLRKHIPNKWSPISVYSKYDFNEYFKSKTKELKE